MKPKEFALDLEEFRSLNSYELKSGAIPGEGWLHVIEYSAYETLHKVLEEISQHKEDWGNGDVYPTQAAAMAKQVLNARPDETATKETK